MQYREQAQGLMRICKYHLKEWAEDARPAWHPLGMLARIRSGDELLK